MFDGDTYNIFRGFIDNNKLPTLMIKHAHNKILKKQYVCFLNEI